MMLRRLLAVGALLAGASSLVGCQSAGEESQATQPVYMSTGSQAMVDRPTITPAMEYFDANIGDSATKTGGGMAH